MAAAGGHWVKGSFQKAGGGASAKEGKDEYSNLSPLEYGNKKMSSPEPKRGDYATDEAYLASLDTWLHEREKHVMSHPKYDDLSKEEKNDRVQSKAGQLLTWATNDLTAENRVKSTLDDLASSIPGLDVGKMGASYRGVSVLKLEKSESGNMPTGKLNAVVGSQRGLNWDRFTIGTNGKLSPKAKELLTGVVMPSIDSGRVATDAASAAKDVAGLKRAIASKSKRLGLG